MRNALRTELSCSAADKYAELIYGDPACAVDYIDSSAVVVCEQPGRFMERARDYIKSIQEDISALNSSGRMQAKAEDFHVSEQSVWQKLSERCVYFADAFTAGRYPLEPESIIQIQAKQLPSYGGSAEQAKEDPGALQGSRLRRSGAGWRFQTGEHTLRHVPPDRAGPC